MFEAPYLAESIIVETESITSATSLYGKTKQLSLLISQSPSRSFLKRFPRIGVCNKPYPSDVQHKHNINRTAVREIMDGFLKVQCVAESTNSPPIMSHFIQMFMRETFMK
jgi:hypothetical protein